MQQEEPTLQDLQTMVLALTRERLERPPAAKRRSVPPSKQRYLATHPTVSVRVELDLYTQLKELKEKHNMTFLDVLKVGLERCEQLELIKVLKTRISQEENTSP